MRVVIANDLPLRDFSIDCELAGFIGANMASISKDPTFLDPRDRIWSLYLEDAEKRGKARLEQWKGDAEGILIFTGLFAATVATFVVSTLPLLSPDSGSQTVDLLTQVLAVLSNNTGTATVTIRVEPDPPVFKVPRSAVQVNTLWLMSLCLSISCALAATLLQQWSRTYVRDAHRHTNLVTRGLVHAALEYGISRFRMEHAATAIMFLLHASVFLFYAGLLVLLFSTNTIIAQILSAVLGFGGLVYFGLSLMPIFVCDTPYHTPISPLLVLICRTVLQIYVLVLDYAKRHNLSRPSSSWARERTLQPTERGRLTSFRLVLSLSTQTQLVWHRYAFRQLLGAADELHEVLAFWESYMDFIQSPKLDSVFLQPFVRSDVDVYQGLATILKAADNGEYDFSRVVVLACGLVRHVLDFRVTTAELARNVLRRLRFTFFPADIGAKPGTGVESREAQQIYVTQVHSMVMNMALLDRAWLQDFAYCETVERLCDALGLSWRHSIIDANHYSAGESIVAGFVNLLRQILAWSHIPTTTSAGTSWLSVVRHIHGQAIHCAGMNTVAASYIDADRHPVRLRPESDLAKLLSSLGITDYKDIVTIEDQSGAPGQPVFTAVHPKYQHILGRCPSLAHMLHSLCVMLVERRDTTRTSLFIPLTPERTATQQDLLSLAASDDDAEEVAWNALHSITSTRSRARPLRLQGEDAVSLDTLGRAESQLDEDPTVEREGLAMKRDQLGRDNGPVSLGTSVEEATTFPEDLGEGDDGGGDGWV